MADIYVRRTDGNNADNGSTWALAKLDLAGAAAIDAAGDNIYLSQVHSETTGSVVTLSFAGTASNPVKVICVNDSAEPPTAVAATALMATTGASQITINGCVYAYGIEFRGGSSGNGSINLGGPAPSKQKFENCIFNSFGNNSSQRVLIGTGGATNPCDVTWENCYVKFSNAGNGVQGGFGKLVWRGGGMLSGGTNPTIMFYNGNNTNRIAFTWEINSIDLSAASSSLNLFQASSNGTQGYIVNSKLPASWTGSLFTGTRLPYDRIAMYNCDSTDTNYRLWIEDYSGSIVSETTIIRTDGATDGTTPISWKMTTSANANEYVAPLISDPISVWNDTTGSAKTITVEIIHDSVTALNDDEVWLEVTYLGTSGYPLGSVITDHRADILATPAAQTSSSETWTTTGLTNPNKQKLSVSITPQEKGLITARVFLGKPSYTIYVDPKITVT